MNGYMNSPEEPEEIPFAGTGWYNGTKWVKCPICGKRQFSITPITKIEHLWYRCRNSKCKADMMINVR